MEDRRRELEERLGRWRTAAGRELEALTEATEGEEVRAAVYGALRRRGWIIVATDRGIHLSRRPRVFGRDRYEFWPWSELRGVTARPTRVDLEFEDRAVELKTLAPHSEYVRFVDAARDGASGSGAETRSEELREMANRKLGKVLAFGLEGSIDALPDRLLDGERVERVASAKLDFDGLLAVTNQRVVLYDVGLRRAGERLWEIDRDEVLGAVATDDGLRLELASGPVTFTGVLPDERREELAAALWRG